MAEDKRESEDLVRFSNLLLVCNIEMQINDGHWCVFCMLEHMFILFSKDNAKLLRIQA